MVAIRILSLALSLSRGASAHPDSLSAANAVQAFHDALRRGDSTAALAMLAPDVVIMESGDVEDYAHYRSHHVAADIEFVQAVPEVRTPQVVTVSGDAAWSVSTSTTSGAFKGRAVNSAGAELVVLRRSGGAWKIVAIHWSSHRKAPPG